MQNRKLPALTPENTAFWQGGRNKKLLIHYCEDCARFFHPPQPACPSCIGGNVAPRAVSGRGKIASFTVNCQAWTPDLKSPFVIAIVELEEQAGLRFLTNIVGTNPDDVAIDMSVRVVFENIEDVWIPVFEEDK